MEDGDRQQLPESQAQQAGERTEHSRVEQEDLNGHETGCALWANVRDQPAPGGHCHKHGVERKHETHQRADCREQRLALALGSNRHPEQRGVEVTRLDVDRCGGRQPLEPCPHFAFAPGHRLYEDPGDPPLHSRQPLRIANRGKRDGAVDQTADVGFSKRGAQQRLRDGGADLDLQGLQRADPDFFGEWSRERDRPLRGELRGGEAPQQRSGELREAWIGADQVDRPLLTARPDDIGLLLEHRQRHLHAGNVSSLCQQPFAEPAGASRFELELRVADDLSCQLGDRVRETCARHLRGEQQRDTDSDSEDREALLHEYRARAQARTVEPEDVHEAHVGHRQSSLESEDAGTNT
jgi:hypothetical protein